MDPGIQGLLGVLVGGALVRGGYWLRAIRR